MDSENRIDARPQQDIEEVKRKREEEKRKRERDGTHKGVCWEVVRDS